MRQFDPHADRITTSLDSIVQEQVNELNQSMDAIVAGAQTSVIVGIVGGVLAAVIMLVLGVFPVQEHLEGP